MTSVVGRCTVVVLTHNRKPEVLRTLQRLGELPERPSVIVVDNGSTDGTATAVSRAGGVTLVQLPQNIGGAGRNAGLRAATTPYVALCDDDTWWEPGSVATATAALERDPRLAVVVARVLVGATATLDPVCRLMAATLPDDGTVGRPIVGFLAGAAMVRREPFLRAGGFSPHYFIGGEEELLGVDLLRAGWRMRYLPDAVVRHHPSQVRDARARRITQLRNGLWTAWLRYPLTEVGRRWARVASTPGATGPVLRDTARALPWLLMSRRPVPPDLRRLLEGAGAVGGRARD